jgi:hypothetical protein
MPHDFFLSYATLDNIPAIPGRPEYEWVTTFHGVLTTKLQYFLGREADTFFDRGDLSGNSALTPEIDAALENSRLFVAISSPAYYARPWCKLERHRFITGLGVNPSLAKRVFVIHTIDVDPLIKPRTWQSEFFPDLRGYYFFREDKASGGPPRTLGAPTLDEPAANANQYYIEIDRLARDMAGRIRELESGSSTQAVEIVAHIGTDAVFLAENAFRSHTEREELRVALGDAGFEVRPETSMAGKQVAELNAAMADALAFVQIVSPVLLEIPGGEGVTYDQVQLAAAAEAGLPSFRWRAPDMDLAAAAANYPGFTEFAEASDVRPQLLPIFKADLLEALGTLRAARHVKQAVQGDERLVLITGESSDLDKYGEGVAQQLQAHALGHYMTDTPAGELEAEDVRGFLVLYGASKAEWVRDRLRIIRTLPKTRLRDLHVGVYFCPPPPDAAGRRLLFDMPSFQKIRWDDQSSLKAFAASVSQ